MLKIDLYLRDSFVDLMVQLFNVDKMKITAESLVGERNIIAFITNRQINIDNDFS